MATAFVENYDVRPELPVVHVSHTSALVAEMRAMESERPDTLFDDHLARKLAGKWGKKLLKRFSTVPDFNFLAAVRTG